MFSRVLCSMRFSVLLSVCPFVVRI